MGNKLSEIKKNDKYDVIGKIMAEKLRGLQDKTNVSVWQKNYKWSALWG